MNESETNTLLAIDRQIAILQKRKEQLLKAKSLSEMVKGKPFVWVIDSSCNKYFQFVHANNDQVQLSRYGKTITIYPNYFNNNFRVATECEVKQHIQFLASKDLFFVNVDGICGDAICNDAMVFSGDMFMINKLTSEFKPYNSLSNIKQKPIKHMIDPTNCDFYMITVTGEHGSKVRHTDYNLAIKEATRLAKSKNHKAWVTGVVAVVEPIQQEVQVKIITK